MNLVIFILGTIVIAILFTFVVTELALGKEKPKNKIKQFNINDIAKMITQCEGKKVNLPIAQVSEVLRVLNTLTSGRFYTWIKKNIN